MTRTVDITGPLSDRTLAHGRNVMAAASVVLVLAWIPYIDIKSFSPLGFDIKKGGELSVWGILAGVLIYYAIRFGYECWADYSGWIDTYRHNIDDDSGEDRRGNADGRQTKRLLNKFWRLDVAPPTLMFLAALFATYQQVDPLVWPPLP